MPTNRSFTVFLLDLYYKFTSTVSTQKNNCIKEFLNTCTRKIGMQKLNFILSDNKLYTCFNHSISFVGISDLGCISECASLERLNLSRNDICKLTKLAGLNNLTHLNLSANRIVSLGKKFTKQKKKKQLISVINKSVNKIHVIESYALID